MTSIVSFPAIPSLFIAVRPEPPGQYTAQAIGLPETEATAATREEAIEHVRTILHQWLTEGKLVVFPVPSPPGHSIHAQREPSDPLEQEFLQDLARFRQEDLERTLREYEQEA